MCIFVFLTQRHCTMKLFCYASLPLLMLSLLFASEPARAQEKLLGSIEFPNSGSKKAQPFFEQGVLYLHNFEYEDAARAFKKAQIADPDFALAYWGEAKTHNHPIWMRQNREAAMDALSRLGKTFEERQAKAPTQREKDYLNALETLYGNTEAAEGKSKEERDDLYREEMRRLHETYPDDHEAASFYGLSILGTAHEGREFTTYLQAASVLLKVWEKNDKHPGAAHYLIHSYDDPIHASLGLPMAKVYAEIAPAASHAQHMTSHIFVAMGMWDDVVRANEVAREVQNARFLELGKREVVCGHYTYWLEYGYLQQGRFEEAEKVLSTCFDRINDNPSDSERRHFGLMKARYVIDTQDWAAAEKWRSPKDVIMDEYESYVFTDAIAAIHLGDLEQANKYLKKMDSFEESNEKTSILNHEVQAMLALHSGDEALALAQIRKATAIEAKLPYEFGPPNIVKPSQELLGDMYMTLLKYEAAAEAYQKQLEQTPLRTASLLGFARASRQAGQMQDAKKAYEQLAEIWHLADSGIPGYKDAIMSQ